MNNVVDPQLAVSPEQLMQALTQQQQGGKKQKYPMFFGDREQVSELVYDWVAAKPIPKPGLADEINSVYYSLEFNLAQSTVMGSFIDWFSPFYLLSCVNNFTDSLINSKTTEELKLRKEYEEGLKRIGSKSSQYAADIQASIALAKLEREAGLTEQSPFEKKLYKMKEKEIDAKIKRYEDIINGKERFESGNNIDEFGNIFSGNEKENSNGGGNGNIGGNSALAYFDDLTIDDNTKLFYSFDVLGDVNSEFLSYDIELNIDPIALYNNQDVSVSPGINYGSELGYIR